MPNVVIYLPRRDQRELEAEGHDPKQWVKDVVKAALLARRGDRESRAVAPPTGRRTS